MKAKLTSIEIAIGWELVEVQPEKLEFRDGRIFYHAYDGVYEVCPPDRVWEDNEDD